VRNTLIVTSLIADGRGLVEVGAPLLGVFLTADLIEPRPKAGSAARVRLAKSPCWRWGVIFAK
jgi:hypothetical protein